MRCQNLEKKNVTVMSCFLILEVEVRFLISRRISNKQKLLRVSSIPYMV